MKKRRHSTADPLLDETLLDLVIGCLVYSIVFEIIGLIVASDRLSYSLGLGLGTLISILCSISMYQGIIRCTQMDSVGAGRTMALYSFLRALVMFAACGAALFIKRVSFYGVVTGLVGLKLSAYLHVYTNVYITGKLLKKGR